MHANEKLPPFKWAIVYYNRFIPLAILMAGCFYFIKNIMDIGVGEIHKLVTFLVVGGVSFILKEILYQCRATIYQLGESRFYFYIIIIYMSFLMNAFLFNSFDMISVKWGIDYLEQFDPRDFINFKLLVFTPAIAIIWYIFDIELDNAKRKDMDIKALLIDDNQLKKWNHKLVTFATVLSFFVIGLYSIFLLILCFMIKWGSMFISKWIRQLLYLFVSLICFILAINFKIEVINFAHGWWNYWETHGSIALISRQIHTLKYMLNNGLTLIIAPFFLIAALAELRLKKEDIIAIELNTKEKSKNINNFGDMPFGINATNGTDVNLTMEEFNYHALYLGTTGAGKTNAILNNVEYCARKGIPCIMMDGKGSPDLPEKMKYIADRYGKTFKLFTLKPEAIKGLLVECLSAYNPFSTGTFTEWKNRIMSLFASAEGRGQQHFAIGEEDALNTVLAVIKKGGGRIDLIKIFDYIQDIEVIKQMAIETGDEFLKKEVELLTFEQLGDVAKVLKLFILSSYGYLFDTKNKKNVINLQESIINNEIVLFMFDSSAYKEDTKKIAKMVINDINSAFSTLKENTGYIKKCFCIFDEFASYASSNLSDTLTLHRSNGLHGIVGTQGIETISLASPETARVAEEIIACTGTYLILQLQHDKDIERVAKIIGTKDGFEVTRQLDVSEGQGTTGMGSSKQIKEFIVHPEAIRKLRGEDGTGILYRKSYGQAPLKIILRRVKVSD